MAADSGRDPIPAEAGGGVPQHGAARPADAAGAGRYRLSLLGPFMLTGPDGQALEVASRKNRLLLAMLALAPGRSIARDTLAGRLWSETGEEQARASLRQALAVLRRDIKAGDGAFFAGPDGAVAIDAQAVEIDTDLFLSDIATASRTSLVRAIALWRGPFLAEVTAPEPELAQWLGAQRDDFKGRHIAAMDALAPLLAGPDRIDMARRLVAADPLREGSHRQLMEAYVAAGERAQAIRHYDGLRRLLRQDLGVDPSPETQALGERIAAGGSDAPRTLPGAAKPAAPQQRRFLGVLAAAAALFIAAAAGWQLMRPAPTPAVMPSVAVLPFQSLSANPDDARLAEGFTIDTIADLSRYADFRVMARETSDAYRDKAEDIMALGRELKVSQVLKGTFQRDGNKVRVTAQLLDATNGVTLWSDRYDRDIGELFAVQSDVADHIANSLGGREGRVGKTLAVGAKRKPPADLGAYELYLLAQETMYSDLSPAHMKEAQKILDQAIAKDPSFARAYVRYANTFAWLATTEANAGELLQQMVVYARKAVALDAMDADAHAALGYGLTLTGAFDEGQLHLNQALQLTPNAFDILIFESCLAPGVAKEAEAADRAIAINPVYPKWVVPCLRLAYALAGRYADAAEVQSRQPEEEMNTDGYVILAGSLAALGRKDEATALARRGLARFPGLLSIERFALNRGWPPESVPAVVSLMRSAGFPACATAEELAGTPGPVRLPECKG